jgi:hypothetical protein
MTVRHIFEISEDDHPRASTCREISLQKEILACARKRARKSNLPGNGKEI